MALGAGVAIAAAACGATDSRLSVGPIEFAATPGSVTPHLAMAGQVPVVSWLEPTAAGHALRVARRGAGGWDTTGTVVESDSLFVNWADFPSVTPLAAGAWVAHWLQKAAPSTYAYHVRMAVSLDSGRTWGVPFTPHADRSPTEHGFVAMAPWEGGIAAVWLDGRMTGAGGAAGAVGADGQGGSGAGQPLNRSDAQPPAMSLRFTTISRHGEPAPDVEVDARVCDCCQTDLAATRRGLVAVFRDRTDDEVRDIVASRFVDGGWTPAAKVADDGWRIDGCPVNGPQVAARGDSVVVAWFTAAGEVPRVFAAFSTDGGATFGPRVTVHEARPVGRVDVVWRGEVAIVAWLEETATAGRVRARVVRPDGTAGPAVTVAESATARASGFPRMVATDDAVLVAWTDPGEAGGVRVAALRGGSR